MVAGAVAVSLHLLTLRVRCDNTGAMTTKYQPGFGNHFVSEAVAGVLVDGQNSPQHVPHGLYAELSGTAFTAPRAENRRTWVYRIRPSAAHNRPFQQIDQKFLRSTPFGEVPPPPTQMRWNPFPIPSEPTDFVEGLITIGGNGDASVNCGMAAHVYAANRPMKRKIFYNADGEMLIVPEKGTLRLITELGLLDVAPQEIAVIPRGIRFRVESLMARRADTCAKMRAGCSGRAGAGTDRVQRTGQFARLSGRWRL